MKLIHPHGHQEIDVEPNHAARYLEQGWREIANDAPKGNASLSDWQDYAREQGLAEDDIEGQTRDELRSALA